MRHERLRASPRAADAEQRLARALIAAGRAAGVEVAIADHRSRPWASATFVGAQHRLTMTSPPSPGLLAWAAALPDAELALRGHVVASLAVDEVTHDGDETTLAIAVLTLEDG